MTSKPSPEEPLFSDLDGKNKFEVVTTLAIMSALAIWGTYEGGKWAIENVPDFVRHVGYAITHPMGDGSGDPCFNPYKYSKNPMLGPQCRSLGDMSSVTRFDEIEGVQERIYAFNGDGSGVTETQHVDANSHDEDI